MNIKFILKCEINIGLHTVWPDDTLGMVLKDLKKGKSHMALVRDVNNTDDTQDPFYEIKGIITLEDIIEQILGDDIVDETDAFSDSSNNISLNRNHLDWAKLSLLDEKITEDLLTNDEAKAVTAHLRTNYSDAVTLLSDHQLNKFVASTRVSEIPTAVQEYGEALPNDLLYEKGVKADKCTLILSGKVAILVGKDNFRSDVSSWSVLAIRALADKTYAPDFSAYISNGPCRCLRFDRERFEAAVDASALEKMSSANHTNLSSSISLADVCNDNKIDKSINSRNGAHRDLLMKAFRAKDPSSILRLQTKENRGKHTDKIEIPPMKYNSMEKNDQSLIPTSDKGNSELDVTKNENTCTEPSRQNNDLDII